MSCPNPPNNSPTPSQQNPNSGHGHVFPRPDDVRARCGGPGLCAECSQDLARSQKIGKAHATVVETPAHLSQHGGEERKLIQELLGALKAIEAHHIELNNRVGRRLSSSCTLAIARSAIAKAESHPLPAPKNDPEEPIRYLLLNEDAPDESRPTRGFFNAAVTEAFYRGKQAKPLPAPVEEGQTDGASLIQAERRRQVESEKWTAEHDAEHTNQSIAIAAVCYALPDSMREYQSYIAEYAENGGRDLIGFIPKLWPWDREFWKPGDRIRELVKAGALIAAEIDRLQSVSSPTEEAGREK